MRYRNSLSLRRRRFVFASVVAILLGLVAISVVAAQGDLGGKLRAGNDVRIAADETIATDLYVSAGTVTVDGTVNGDLVVTGGTLTLNGTVNGDILAAGGTVRIAGQVDGDVRAAGGQVIVTGSVGEDGLLAGGQLELAQGGTIGEDLIVSGGQITVAGDVTGSIIGFAGTYSRSGQVGGTDEVQVQQFQPPIDRAPNLVADAFRHFLSVLLIGLIALWLAPRFMAVAEGAIRLRPLSVIGWGIAGFVGFIVLLIAIPVITVLLAIVLGLLGFSGLVGLVILAGTVALLGLILAFALVSVFLGDAVVGLALARLASRDNVRSVDAAITTGRTVLLMAIGVAVVVIVTSLPVIGGIARLIVAIVGLGAVLVALWWRRRGEPSPAAAPGAVVV